MPTLSIILGVVIAVLFLAFTAVIVSIIIIVKVKFFGRKKSYAVNEITEPDEVFYESLDNPVVLPLNRRDVTNNHLSEGNIEMERNEAYVLSSHARRIHDTS